MSKLNAEQLHELNGLADSLLQKLAAIEASLGRVATLWSDLPNEDDVDELCRAVSTVEQSLERIPTLVESLPSADDLDELAEQASAIASDLAQCNE